MSEIKPDPEGREEPEAPRLVRKDGDLLVEHNTIKWSNPLFTENAVLLNWAPLCQAILACFLGSWLFFAVIYYFAEAVNESIGQCGDKSWDWNMQNDTTYQEHFDELSKAEQDATLADCDIVDKPVPECMKADCIKKRDKRRCVSELYDFPSALLFSVETMTTIGYGGRAPTKQCLLVVLTTVLQSLSAVLLTGILTGLIMAKFIVPLRARRNLIQFSESAVVMLKDRALYLAVKVVDKASTRLDGVSTRALFVDTATTEEGEEVPLHPRPIDLGIGQDRGSTNTDVPFLWPVTLLHKICPGSPLWDLAPDTLASWELILWVSGTNSSGCTVSARSSYRAAEVVWGAVFEPPVDTTGLDVFRPRQGHITLSGPEGFPFTRTDLPRMAPRELQEAGIID